MLIILLTVPRRSCLLDGGMELEVFDSELRNVHEWKGDLTPKELSAKCEELRRREPPAVATTKVHPFELCFLKNPIPHAVTEITAGDRFVCVIFLGHSY